MDSGQRLSSRSSLSRLHPRPDFINEALPGLFLFLLPCGVPCPQAQEAQHVHFVDFLHAPAVLHQFVVGGIDVFRQGQASCGIVTSGFSASAGICSAYFCLLNRREGIRNLRDSGGHLQSENACALT